VIAGHVIGPEWRNAIAGEEVPFLGDPRPVIDARMLNEKVEPPAGSGLLDSDTHEIGRSDLLSWHQDRRLLIEAALPWRVVPTGVEQR